MKIIHEFPIKGKLILIQLLTTFTVMLFYSIFHIIRDTQFYFNSVSHELTTMTKLVGSSCISALHFLDKEAAQKNLSALEAEENVVNAWIHDSDSVLFAAYYKDGYVLDKPLDKIIKKQDKFIVTSRPIVYEGEIIGFISIRYDMKVYRQIIYKNTMITLIIFLIGMGTAWLLAIFTQRTISDPILKLLESMRIISETGNYGIRPVKQRNDEIGILSDGICEMLEQIQIRENERNAVNRALHESEDKYRNLVERANDGIVILQDGIFKYVNPSLVTMAGCTEQELLGKPFVDFIHEEERSKVMENYFRRMAGETVYSMYETQFKTSSEEVIDAEVNAGFISYLGKPADLVIIRNITRRKQMERELIKHRNHLEELVEERTKELAEANKRLLELDRLKSMFLASMSHELRTPLNSIIGFTGILLMGMAGTLNPEQKKQLEMVKSSASHLLDLINDILDISKIESDKVDLSIQTFDLVDVILEVIKSIRPIADSKNLHLSYHGIENIRIDSDRRRVKQVLMNLISNSVKFTDSGSVTVTLTSINDLSVSVEVKDTGIGIRKEELNILFHPFQQLDMSSTKKYEGTGLGLYLSKKIISLLHGEISVASKYGEGSAFTFVLPIQWQKEKKSENCVDHRGQ
ncbi:PAS domain S-box protein [bacterium]|nr:PAS domain S-box protein [bacterium]